MAKTYAHVTSFCVSHPWALMPEMIPVVAGILARHIAGLDSAEEISAALVNRKNLPQPRTGSVATIPVYGVISPRMNMLSDMSGGTSFEKLGAQLNAAIDDKTVSTIVLDVDSPGGSVAGNAEFAQQLLAARKKKPIVAQAQYVMGSAAYHLASAATEIVAAPSARVGSIGTYMIHNDLSKALADLGIKRTFISAGEGKVDGNDAEPLTETAKARMETAVNDAYLQFVNNVVKGRGVGMTSERVMKDWKAHVYSATEAKANGMIDRIATLDETIARLLSDAGDSTDAHAARLNHSSDLDLERALFELTL